MSRIALADRLAKGVLFLDGAMGTQLMTAVGGNISCNEKLNIESPDIVGGVHRGYLEAGSNVVLTNTFGGNAYSLRRHNLAEKTYQLNLTAVGIARRAAGDGRFVLGDIGPCGDFPEPVGSLKADELRDCFAVQVRGLADGGVDGFIIETMSAIDEIKIALEAIRGISELPVFVSMAFDNAGGDFRTMMGISVEYAVRQIVPLGITAMGFNCGTLDMASYIRLASVFARALKGSGVYLLAEPNAGRPDLVDGRAVYNLSANAFADGLERIHSAGATILGGCCGTGPEHIKAMIQKIRTDRKESKK